MFAMADPVPAGGTMLTISAGLAVATLSLTSVDRGRLGQIDSRLIGLPSWTFNFSHCSEFSNGLAPFSTGL